MRLVDGEQRDRAAVEQPERGLRPQPLRRQVEQVELPGEEGRLDLAALARLLGGVEEPGPHAERRQRVDLVLHERDQRRDDHADAAPHQRRDLVAQRLAAAGRHEHERVAAGDDVLDDLLLAAAERVVAEDPLQHPRRGVHFGTGLGQGHFAILRRQRHHRIITAAAVVANGSVRRHPRRGVLRDISRCWLSLDADEPDEPEQGECGGDIEVQSQAKEML